MRKVMAGTITALLFMTATAQAWQLQIWNEFARFTPDGQLIKQDWTGQRPEPLNTVLRPNRIQALRNGYVSLVLLVTDDKGGPFKISATQQEGPPVELDLYRAWYHYSPKAPASQPSDKPAAWMPYVPDALIPITNGQEMSLPAADNRVPNQKAQMFWLDVFVPRDAKPGKQITVKVTLNTAGFNSEAYAILDTQWFTYPDEDIITADHNSYGMGFLASQYPQLRQKLGDNWSTSNEIFGLMQEYYKLHYEHRGTFHNLGYSHNGAVNEAYAPQLAGYGETRHPANWDLFDRHFGPLLDGSAFKDTRRGPRPIPYMYLTINPEWPARYVLFGSQGYETEFVNSVRKMIHHFERKGWTKTKFEMFFNHKKRYKGFEWDGDETRWPKDDVYFKLYKRLLAQATPRNTPVQMIFRQDASWRMLEQWESLNGVIDLWVCGAGMFSWFPWAPQMLHDRGELVWIYGGTPTAWEPIINVMELPLLTWKWEVDGYCRWLTTDPGQDPWFDFNGGGEATVYSGERFGMEKPIPSIRLKIERDVLQDIAVLKAADARRQAAATQGWIELPEKKNTDDLWNPTPSWIHTPAESWSNATLSEAVRPSITERAKLDPSWWLGVRSTAVEGAQRNYEPDEEEKAHNRGIFGTPQTQPKEESYAQ